MPLAVIRCYSLLFDVTSCYSLSPLYHSLSLDVTRCTTRCHSPSLFVICCTTRCHSLSLNKPLVCLFINTFDNLVNICHCICAFLLLGYIAKNFEIKRKKLALLTFFFKNHAENEEGKLVSDRFLFFNKTLY